jgi:DNA-binding CsgD family transcriptional regulator
MDTKKIHAFEISVDKLSKIFEKFKSIHLYYKGTDGEILGFNEEQARLFQLSDNSIGKKYYEFAPYEEVKETSANDQLVIKKQATLIFTEKSNNTLALSIKSPLKNSANNTIGVCGLTFRLEDKTPLCDFLSAINQLKAYPTQLPIELIINKLYLNPHYQLLSAREKECANYLINRMTAKEIAGKLNISYKTVENHIENIKQKLHCCRRSKLINMLIE